jgi:alkanesulfonate monooxygenase SsuD/methylene tetrahydromethanopterin reductase-like flavin-dependent oxidoreductase (luciferase family)
MNGQGETRQMKLGLMLAQSGHHVASWLHSEAWPDTELDFSKLLGFARMAEEGLFDFIFSADSLSGEKFTPDTLPRTAIGVRIEPMTLLTALAAVTEHIGLVCTATTTYDQPYLVARRFASLDHVSGGRGGWNVVTSAMRRRPATSAAPPIPTRRPAIAARGSSSRSCRASGTASIRTP